MIITRVAPFSETKCTIAKCHTNKTQYGFEENNSKERTCWKIGTRQLLERKITWTPYSGLGKQDEQT